MGHSIIPPSSAWIWGAPDGCTKWVFMNQAYPETEESEDSREGTAAHEIGAQIITDARTGNCKPHNASDWVGITASNGVVFTEVMFDSAKVYADDVIAVMRRTSVFSDEYMCIEQSVEIPVVHELNHGTPDANIYHKKGNALYVWDFKHGHKVVEAFENWQGIEYVAGLLDKYEIDGHLDQQTKVHIRIVQPRAFHREGIIRTWVVLASDLRGYFNTLHDNAHISLSDDAKFTTGGHCKDCPGRHACPAALKAGMGLYEVSMKSVPVELSSEALGVQLNIVTRARKQLEYLESGFQEQLKSVVKSGNLVAGWSVEQGYGWDKWDKPTKEVIALGDMLDINLRKPEEPITPTQAKKLGIDEAVIKQYSIKNRTGLKVVPDNGNKAKQVFKK